MNAWRGIHRCLGGETGRTHTEKSEAPVHEIEDERSERDRAQVCGLANVSDDGCIDQTEQRHSAVGQNDRLGHVPDSEITDYLRRI